MDKGYKKGGGGVEMEGMVLIYASSNRFENLSSQSSNHHATNKHYQAVCIAAVRVLFLAGRT